MHTNEFTLYPPSAHQAQHSRKAGCFVENSDDIRFENVPAVFAPIPFRYTAHALARFSNHNAHTLHGHRRRISSLFFISSPGLYIIAECSCFHYDEPSIYGAKSIGRYFLVVYYYVLRMRSATSFCIIIMLCSINCTRLHRPSNLRVPGLRSLVVSTTVNGFS